MVEFGRIYCFNGSAIEVKYFSVSIVLLYLGFSVVRIFSWVYWIYYSVLVFGLCVEI